MTVGRPGIGMSSTVRLTKGYDPLRLRCAICRCIMPIGEAALTEDERIVHKRHLKNKRK